MENSQHEQEKDKFLYEQYKDVPTPDLALDLTKSFCIVHPVKDGWIVMESNLPNDQIGDFAFEYDFDGSHRRQWAIYLAKLLAAGTLGDLVYRKFVFRYNPAFDGKIHNTIVNYPLSSYRFLMLDMNDKSGQNSEDFKIKLKNNW